MPTTIALRKLLLNVATSESVTIDVNELRELRVEQDKIRKQTEQIKWLEGALCAIITELNVRGIADEIIADASINGAIDLHKFWNLHKKSDEERLQKEISKMSFHEREIVKRLLNQDQQ